MFTVIVTIGFFKFFFLMMSGIVTLEVNIVATVYVKILLQ